MSVSQFNQIDQKVTLWTHTCTLAIHLANHLTPTQPLARNSVCQFLDMKSTGAFQSVPKWHHAAYSSVGCRTGRQPAAELPNVTRDVENQRGTKHTSQLPARVMDTLALYRGTKQWKAPCYNSMNHKSTTPRQYLLMIVQRRWDFGSCFLSVKPPLMTFDSWHQLEIYLQDNCSPQYIYFFRQILSKSMRRLWCGENPHTTKSAFTHLLPSHSHSDPHLEPQRVILTASPSLSKP